MGEPLLVIADSPLPLGSLSTVAITASVSHYASDLVYYCIVLR